MKLLILPFSRYSEKMMEKILLFWLQSVVYTVIS